MGNEWLMDPTKAWQVCKLFSRNDFMKSTLSRSFKHHFAFSQYVDDFLYGSQNYDEHFSTWTLLNFRSIFTGWLIKHHSLISFFSFNVFLAYTATLGNTLIFIALHKVSSIHPSTKFLLSCLAISDFVLALLFTRFWLLFCMMQIERGKWYILHLTVRTLNFIFCGFSIATATAISVERLLALLLGLRYRHTVTLRRVRCLAVCFLFANIVTGFTYSVCSQDFANSAGFVVIISSLFLSVFCHAKIFFKLRQHQPKYDNMLDMKKQTAEEFQWTLSETKGLFQS